MINLVGVRLRLLPMHVHPTFHLSRLKPTLNSNLDPASNSPPARIVDGGPAYTVEALQKSHRRGRGFQYLVDWEGYDPEEQSWVPSQFIQDLVLISQFHLDHPGQPVGPSVTVLSWEAPS